MADLVAGHREVDVPGRPGAIPEPVVEREGALQDPALRGHGHEAGQQPVEDDLLAQPGE